MSLPSRCNDDAVVVHRHGRAVATSDMLEVLIAPGDRFVLEGITRWI
jgi:hypothetical protein